MKEAEEQNPKLFNDVLSSINTLAGKDPIDNSARGIQVVKDSMKESTMQDDAAISVLSEKNPNSTAISQAVLN